MNNPKVTVLMSVYNGMPYLKQSVDTILNQSLDNFKFLIIDDGSTDHSANYLEGIKDDRVEIIKQDNQGLGAALNRGLEIIDTEYMARMDADDIAHPDRLRLQLNKMEADHDLIMLGTGIAFTLDGVHSGFPPPMPKKNQQIRSVLLNGGHGISHGTIMCRTNAVKKAGAYRVQGVGQDWDFFLRMTEAGKVANLEEILLLVRLHEQSNAWKSSEKVIRGKKYALICAKARMLGNPEPSMDKFLRDWKDKSLKEQALRKVKIISDDAYRLGIVEFLKGRRGKGILALMISALLNPKKVLLYIKRKLFYQT